MFTPTDLATYNTAYAATGNARDAYAIAFPFTTAIRRIEDLDQADASAAFLADLLAA